MTTAQREIDLRIIHSLCTYIERLEKERDNLRGEVENADASYTAQREAFEVQLVRAMNAEDERDSLKAQMQEWMEGSTQLQVKLEKAVKAVELLLKGREWSMGFAVIAAQARTLAGLSVQQDVLTCERVSVPVPCETCTLHHRYVERCKYHGCPWPDGEKGCPA